MFLYLVCLQIYKFRSLFDEIVARIVYKCFTYHAKMKLLNRLLKKKEGKEIFRMYILHSSNEFVSRVFVFKMKKKKKKTKLVLFDSLCFQWNRIFFFPIKAHWLQNTSQSISIGSAWFRNNKQFSKKDKIEMGYSLTCHVSKFIKTANCKIIPMI